MQNAFIKNIKEFPELYTIIEDTPLVDLMPSRGKIISISDSFLLKSIVGGIKEIEKNYESYLMSQIFTAHEQLSSVLRARIGQMFEYVLKCEMKIAMSWDVPLKQYAEYQYRLTDFQVNILKMLVKFEEFGQDKYYTELASVLFRNKRSDLKIKPQN